MVVPISSTWLISSVPTPCSRSLYGLDGRVAAEVDALEQVLHHRPHLAELAAQTFLQGVGGGRIRLVDGDLVDQLFCVQVHAGLVPSGSSLTQSPIRVCSRGGPRPADAQPGDHRASTARRRDPRSPIEAIRHLIAVQAQEPFEPYVGLWSRLEGFEPGQLVELLENRRAVRTLLMRRTLHLVTSEDCLALRPHHQSMLVARARGTLGRMLPGVDFDELAAAGEPLFAETPRTLSEVGRAVNDRWPEAAPRVLGDALSSLVPLVQIPPRGIWGTKAPARNTTIRVLARPGSRRESTDDVLDELVLRYLAAYGPAASSDVRSWSGLSGLPAVIKRLRPRLRTLPRRARSRAAGSGRARCPGRRRARAGAIPARRSTTRCWATTTGRASSTTSIAA